MRKHRVKQGANDEIPEIEVARRCCNCKNMAAGMPFEGGDGGRGVLLWAEGLHRGGVHDVPDIDGASGCAVGGFDAIGSDGYDRGRLGRGFQGYYLIACAGVVHGEFVGVLATAEDEVGVASCNGICCGIFIGICDLNWELRWVIVDHCYY